MSTATVRELRNNFAELERRLAAGEEIVITKSGRPVARLTPESAQPERKVDWSKSSALTRDRSGERVMSAEEVASVLDDAGGKW